MEKLFQSRGRSAIRQSWGITFIYLLHEGQGPHDSNALTDFRSLWCDSICLTSYFLRGGPAKLHDAQRALGIERVDLKGILKSNYLYSGR